MIKNFYQWIGRNWIKALVFLVLIGSSFGSGYWAGERSHSEKLNPLAARGMASHPYAPDLGSVRAYMPPPSVTIPPYASPELKEFLQNRITLSNKLAQLRAQNPNSAQDLKLTAQFQQDNATLLQRQKELAQIISKQPIPDPPPLQIPLNASPEMKTFLTTRDQLMRDQIKLMNEHRTDDPKARQAALQQWRQQNTALFNQLRQEAQALAKAKQT